MNSITVATPGATLSARDIRDMIDDAERRGEARGRQAERLRLQAERAEETDDEKETMCRALWRIARSVPDNPAEYADSVLRGIGK